MNRIDDPSLTDQGLDPNPTNDGLEILRHLGDWLTADQHFDETGPDDDLRTVTALAAGSLSKFVQTQENAEALTHVLDGAYRGNRDADVQATMDGVLVDLADSGLDIDFVLADVGDLFEETGSRAVLPENVEAAIIYSEGSPPTVLLSSGLGFRDMILVAQQAAVDVLVDMAQSAGMDLAAGDVSAQLISLIRTGELPPEDPATEIDEFGEAQPVVSVLFNGEITDASIV